MFLNDKTVGHLFGRFSYIDNINLYLITCHFVVLLMTLTCAGQNNSYTCAISDIRDPMTNSTITWVIYIAGTLLAVSHD